MGKTKIEWCDITINPVIGCIRGCEYCYAKKLNDRFKFVEDFSNPQLFLDKLKQIDKIKNKVIFMNSMSDIFLWGLKTLNAVEKTIIDNPTNIYIFLSKSSSHHLKYLLKYKNVYIGYTVTDYFNFHEEELSAGVYLKDYFNFVNIEPLFTAFDIKEHLSFFNSMKWVIIGAETGNRKDKVIPKREWIENILRDLKEIGYTGKIFMKNNLKKIYPDIELIQEYPFESSK